MRLDEGKRFTLCFNLFYFNRLESLLGTVSLESLHAARVTAMVEFYLTLTLPLVNHRTCYSQRTNRQLKKKSDIVSLELV